MKLSELDGQRVALWGFGREGRASLAALRRRLPALPLSLLCTAEEAAQARQQDADLRIFDGPVSAEVLCSFDVIVKSPGISPWGEAAAEARARGVRFTSGTALWFGEHAQAHTLCVTGTKGKSTTTALLAHLLRRSGQRTALAGNIGLPLLELLDATPPPHWWAIELSSYQTGDAITPEVALILNLFPEHLDWHGSQARYAADKLALATVARPRRLVLDAQNPELIARLAQVEAPRTWFNHPQGWHLRGSALHHAERFVLDAAALPLPGRHNHLNLCAALAVIDAAGFDARELAAHALDFKPLPHRLQSLGWRHRREYVNDSISTTPQAALAALAHHAHRPVALILGGYDRGLDWSPFFTRIRAQAPRALVTLGQNGPRIAAGLEPLAAAAGFSLAQARDMPEAVALAERLLGPEGVVLLSPGAPSFPEYRDYVERGRDFARIAGFDPEQISSIPGLGLG